MTKENIPMLICETQTKTFDIFANVIHKMSKRETAANHLGNVAHFALGHLSFSVPSLALL